jgi:hypothetical protein
MLPEVNLSLYKIEKGPGDVCLVHVNNGSFLAELVSPNPSLSLSDCRVAFIRGNVAVYLSSYYKNFGCMDLACRLDALILEQIRKANKDKTEHEETKK